MREIKCHPVEAVVIFMPYEGYILVRSHCRCSVFTFGAAHTDHTNAARALSTSPGLPLAAVYLRPYGGRRVCTLCPYKQDPAGDQTAEATLAEDRRYMDMYETRLCPAMLMNSAWQNGLLVAIHI